MSISDQERAAAASAEIAREQQVREAERDLWDRGVAHIQQPPIDRWQPTREQYQWAVQENRREAERWAGERYQQPGRDVRGVER